MWQPSAPQRLVCSLCVVIDADETKLQVAASGGLSVSVPGRAPVLWDRQCVCVLALCVGALARQAASHLCLSGGGRVRRSTLLPCCAGRLQCLQQAGRPGAHVGPGHWRVCSRVVEGLVGRRGAGSTRVAGVSCAQAAGLACRAHRGCLGAGGLIRHAGVCACVCACALVRMRARAALAAARWRVWCITWCATVRFSALGHRSC